MEFQEDENTIEPTQPQTPAPIPDYKQNTRPPEGTRKKSGWRILSAIALFLSILLNGFLFLLLVGVVATFVTGSDTDITEQVIREGPSGTKIAVITIEGTIDNQQAEEVYNQLKKAQKDNGVKAVIIQINSPGGTLSASDQIHYEISNFRTETNKPVIAFMQSMAASGGYYSAVACEKIIAEPTVITGSIGVIASYYVLEELLEEKLGVQPVVIKSGQRKDWPSSFREPTEQEIDYLQEKMIKPAIERFEKIVAEGRREVLTPADVNRLSDGSIYSAQEALDEKLIDSIGYLDDAIELVKSIADIGSARVVKYQEPFSLSSIFSLSTENSLKINRETLREFTTPQVMYLWSDF